jgi:hypothetical protein
MLTFFYLLGVIWSFPVIIAALLLMLWYRPQRIRWDRGCIEFVAGRKKDKKGRDRTRIWGKPGGQCIGVPVIAYATEADWNAPPLKIHERRHCVQGLILGLLFGPLYGGHWLLIRVFDTPDEPANMPAWKRAYRAIWFEQDARRHTRENPDGWGA